MAEDKVIEEGESKDSSTAAVAAATTNGNEKKKRWGMYLEWNLHTQQRFQEEAAVHFKWRSHCYCQNEVEITFLEADDSESYCILILCHCVLSIFKQD